MREACAWQRFTTRLYAQNQFAIKLGLDNIQRALELEDNPESKVPAILVAGTNGKGSTAAYLASILQAHGLRVGLYTSPHLISLRERFRINGRPVAQQDVLDVGQKVLENYGEASDKYPCLTFFELTTLMATLLFAAQELDVAVYEVGLGGRLDAVNAIDPVLSIITSIDFDHQEYLGETLAEITREKCGILRRDRAVPAVIGSQKHAEVLKVIDQISPSIQTRVFGRDYDSEMLRDIFPLHTLSALMNMGCALDAARCFLRFRQWKEHLAVDALKKTFWPGRMQWLDYISTDGARAQILMDAAHNPAGVELLFDHIDAHKIKVSAVVCGAMKDKDLHAMFAPLRTREIPVYASLINNPRSATEAQLRSQLPASKIRSLGATALVMEHALEQVATDAAEEPGILLIFGSIFLLGECLQWLGFEEDDLVTHIDLS